ncbi:MAG: hypothetical protein H7240_07210 [Glaciimonas sp.]|nr:hypothetical protein [Glaciimonas sp.]
MIQRFFGVLSPRLVAAIAKDFEAKIYRLFDFISEERLNNGKHMHLVIFPEDSVDSAMTCAGEIFFNRDFDQQSYQHIKIMHKFFHALHKHKLKDIVLPSWVDSRKAEKRNKHLFKNVGTSFAAK